MKLILPAVLLAGLLAAPVQAQTTPGEALFKERCALCHMDVDDSAPSEQRLRTHDAPFILDKLNNGTMQPMAAGLTDEQKASIAAFLTTPSATPAPAQ
jgi:polyvinyl alcohol dehydrogenase (cytochrome)